MSVRVGVLLALAAAVTVSVQPTPRRGLTGVAPLARAYDAILDAQFGAVPDLLAAACPPAPAEACQVLEAVALWWRIQLDPLDTTRDARFEALVNVAIASTEGWVTREPERAEAWFYLGGAYGARAQWRAARREILAAARDGKRIKLSLERALSIDPDMHDAYFGIGLYHYYADVAPTAAKVLRWLLLLPGGDRAQGLQEMLRARTGGQLARSEADYQLQLIYLWYERQPARALEILAGLQKRHPHNPHFLQLTAEIHDVYRSDPRASLEAWQALLALARQGRVAEPAMAAATADLGAAAQLHRLGQYEAAAAHAQDVITARAAAPYAAVARAHLQLGESVERLGRHDAAAAAYREAIAAAPADDRLKIKSRAAARLRGLR